MTVQDRAYTSPIWYTPLSTSRSGNRRAVGICSVTVSESSGRLVKHARYYWLLLAEGHLTRRLFGDMLRRIWAPPVPAD